MNRNYILASASPRRVELLSEYVRDFYIMPAKTPENLTIENSPVSAVMFLGYKKASAVAQEIIANPLILNQTKSSLGHHLDIDSELIVIGADTVVDHNRIIGKPTNKEDALSILMDLSGNSHYVHTGVALINLTEVTDNVADKKGFNVTGQKVFFETTKVYFKEYKPSDLEVYLDTEEPYDKAGAYAIQGYFSRFIDHIDGDYNNVIGLPLSRLIQELTS